MSKACIRLTIALVVGLGGAVWNCGGNQQPADIFASDTGRLDQIPAQDLQSDDLPHADNDRGEGDTMTRTDTVISDADMDEIEPEVDTDVHADASSEQFENDLVECDSTTDSCGPNQTCLADEEAGHYCHCLHPFQWWDNIDLPSEPEIDTTYKLESRVLCEMSMPKEYFEDIPDAWWAEDYALYGVPDDVEYVELVTARYDDASGELHFDYIFSDGFRMRIDGVGILRPDNPESSTKLLRLTKDRAEFYYFDWPSGKLLIAHVLVPY